MSENEYKFGNFVSSAMHEITLFKDNTVPYEELAPQIETILDISWEIFSQRKVIQGLRVVCEEAELDDHRNTLITKVAKLTQKSKSCCALNLNQLYNLSMRMIALGETDPDKVKAKLVKPKEKVTFSTLLASKGRTTTKNNGLQPATVVIFSNKLRVY